METPTQPPSPPPEQNPQPQPPPPQEVEISLEPPTPQLVLPPPPESPDTTEVEKAKRQALVEKAQSALAEAYDVLLQLTGAEAPAATDVLDKEIRALMTKADEHDVLLSFDVRLTDKSGTVVHMAGHNMMHAFSDQMMLSEAPRNFEALLYTALFRPLKNKQMAYINRFVKNDNLLQPDPTLGRHNTSPELPKTGPNSFLSEPGEV